MSKLADIIAAQIAAFGGITVANGRHTEIGVSGGVANVFDGFPMNKPLDASQCPGIVLLDVENEIMDLVSYTWDRTIKMEAYLILVAGSGETSEALGRRVRAFVADFEYVIGQNQSWGGNAIATKCTRWSLTMQEGTVAVTGAKVEYEVQYETGAFGET